MRVAFVVGAFEISTTFILGRERSARHVAVPALSRLADAPAAYCAVTRLLLVVTVPLGALMLLSAEAFIPLLLGAHWDLRRLAEPERGARPVRTSVAARRGRDGVAGPREQALVADRARLSQGSSAGLSAC